MDWLTESPLAATAEHRLRRPSIKGVLLRGTNEVIIYTVWTVNDVSGKDSFWRPSIKVVLSRGINKVIICTVWTVNDVLGKDHLERPPRGIEWRTEGSYRGIYHPSKSCKVPWVFSRVETIQDFLIKLGIKPWMGTFRINIRSSLWCTGGALDW